MKLFKSRAERLSSTISKMQSKGYKFYIHTINYRCANYEITVTYDDYEYVFMCDELTWFNIHRACWCAKENAKEQKLIKDLNANHQNYDIICM